MALNKRDQLLICSFRDSSRARAALHDLRDAEFSAKDIGIVTRDDDGETQLKSFKELEGNRAGTGAAVGAGVGAGGGALWALGIAAGVLPAIGPVVAGGLLGAVLASAGIGAAGGGLVGALTGAGVSDEDAAYYDEELRQGRTVVVVNPGKRAGEATRILTRNDGRFREAPVRPTPAL